MNLVEATWIKAFFIWSFEIFKFECRKMIAATEKNKIILGSQIILIYVNKKTHQNTLLPYQPTFMNKRNEKKQFKSQYCSHDMCYDSNHIFIAHKKDSNQPTWIHGAIQIFCWGFIIIIILLVTEQLDEIYSNRK